MRSFLLAAFLSIVVLGCSLGDRSPGPEGPEAVAGAGADPHIELVLSTSTPVVKLGETPSFSAQLVNQGNRTVTLVLPGDSSEDGWRTPIIIWTSPHKNGTSMRCGNINPVRSEDVFTLLPGRKQDLGSWIGQPQLGGPGTYHVTLHYENIPGMEWKGIPLREHDVAAMRRIKDSTPIKLTSNAVQIVVTR